MKHIATFACLIIAVGQGAWHDGHRDYDRPGSSFKDLVTYSPKECYEACGTVDRCAVWTWNRLTGTCLLKDKHYTVRPAKNMVSGVRSGANVLQPRAFVPLPVGAITPSGWLLKQLRLQEAGLCGHLALFWKDIEQSVWIGGDGDQGLHERTPYWLNGVTPLSYLLRNADAAGGSSARIGDDICQDGVDMMYHDISNFQVQNRQECHDRCVAEMGCVGFVVDDCDPNHVNCWLKNFVADTIQAQCRCFGTIAHDYPSLWNQTHTYLQYILEHQDDSGWMGPADNEKDGNIYWGRYDVMQAFSMWAEAEPDLFDRITSSMLKFMQEVQRRINDVQPLDGWSKTRWADLELSVQWLLEHAPQGQEQALWDLGETLHEQGADWEQWFHDWTGDAGTHGVNNAQGLKSAAVWWRQSNNDTLPMLSHERMGNMDMTYGMPNGMFCADEQLCEAPEQKHPSRGTELCAVVEAMFSYETMFSVHGDPVFADRAERIAFTANPATWGSQVGGDMWNHQYLQAVNEITAEVQDDHIWTHDGADSELYGLEPNYGCCTANFPQGWPKFASLLFFSTADKGVAVGIYAPASAKLADGSTISVVTDYPFDDVVNITVQAKNAMPVYLRIPTWADSAVIQVNGKPADKPVNGTMYKVSATAGTTTMSLKFNPSIRLEQWYAGSVSVHRGPLMFSVNIPGAYKVLNQYAFDSVDFSVSPQGEWKYVLDIDPSNPAKDLVYVQQGYVPNSAPFNHTNWPCYIEAPVRVIADWGLEHNSAAAPFNSPVCDSHSCGDQQKIKLVPHGSTDLRMAELPLASYHVPQLPIIG